jgi:PAS domain S-box-containing protein
MADEQETTAQSTSRQATDSWSMDAHEHAHRATMTANAHEAVIGSNSLGTITTWNPGAQRLLGWSSHEAVGRNLHELTVPADREDEAHRVQQLVQCGQDVLPIPTQRLDRNGTVIDVLLSVTPTWDEQGRVTGAVMLLRRKRPVLGVPDQGGDFDAAANRSHEPSAALSAILNSAASAIITTDLHGLITSFNPAAEVLFRMTEAQALARPITEISDRQEAPGRTPAVAHQAAGGAAAALDVGTASGGRRGDHTYIRADGTRFPGLLSISMLRDAAGQALGILCIITDLTERKQMEEALRERTVQAEAANRAKSAFLAHMSHEFRTPLNAVIGLSQLLQQMPLPEKIRTFVSHIHQAGEQLLLLTDDVLDLSRIEAGELKLDHLPFELPSLLDAVRVLVQPQADAKSLSLRLDMPAELPVHLLGDSLRLKQVLINLMGNAVKFTLSGRVELRVRQLARTGTRVTLRFCVFRRNVTADFGIVTDRSGRS